MKFSCPHCHQHLEANDSLAGATVNCPSCGTPFTIEVTDEPSGALPLPPPPEERQAPVATPIEQETALPPESDALPPPKSDPPKAKPRFRVVSRPRGATPRRPETPSQPSPDGKPQAAPTFRVVSRPQSSENVSARTNLGNPPRSDTEAPPRKTIDNLRNRFNDFTGLEKLEGFSLIGLFSEIFGKHKPEDVEDMFTVGTARATPSIEEVDTSWPRPWMFFRALAGSIALYILFNIMWHYFGNPQDIPGMIMMGTVAVPLSTLLFFYEVNVRRNISLYQVLKLVFAGGILSLLLTSVISSVIGETSDVVGLALAGPIEESAKLLALVLAARSLRYHYKLNGLLMGAAIGTGFAVFESMGYAFIFLVESGEIGVMKEVIFVRGVLSPLGHIVWTAIAGAALWRVKGTQPFRFSMLGQGKFWHLFLIPVLLHSLWDIPLFSDMPYCGKPLVLGFVAWFVAIALVQEGLKELRAEKSASFEANAASSD